MRLGKERMKQVFVYKQKPRKEFNKFKERTAYIGDFNVRTGNRKRVVGKTPRAMALTLSLNLDISEFDGISLRTNAQIFESLVRNGASVPVSDEICSLEPSEVQTVLLELGRDGFLNIKVDRS